MTLDGQRKNNNFSSILAKNPSEKSRGMNHRKQKRNGLMQPEYILELERNRFRHNNTACHFDSRNTQNYQKSTAASILKSENRQSNVRVSSLNTSALAKCPPKNTRLQPKKYPTKKNTNEKAAKQAHPRPLTQTCQYKSALQAFLNPNQHQF